MNFTVNDFIFQRKTFVINADGVLETTCYPFKIKDGAKADTIDHLLPLYLFKLKYM